MRAVGFKKLIKDAGLELKVFDLEQMSRLFAVKSGAKVKTRTTPRAATRIRLSPPFLLWWLRG